MLYVNFITVDYSGQQFPPHNAAFKKVVGWTELAEKLNVVQITLL